MHWKKLTAVAWVLAIALTLWENGSASAPWPVQRQESFVEVNGVRLQYLDWGGTGPALILIHGLGDNPYVFDDLAPAFTDRFHVIAYARRGCGSSEAKGPYDIGTLTRDLLGLMDALKISQANFVGYSAGGSEVTEMAAQHPERTQRIVYFDGGYDLADPDFRTAVKAFPGGFFALPAGASSSLEAFREYLKSTTYPDLDDMNRIEANLRAKVLIQADGSVKYRTPPELLDAFYAALWTNPRSDYRRIHSPTLAIYADHLFNLSQSDREQADAQRRRALQAYEEKYWAPYQLKSINRIRLELAGAQVLRVPGSHASFLLTDRGQVVDVMRRFLQGGG